MPNFINFFHKFSIKHIFFKIFQYFDYNFLCRKQQKILLKLKICAKFSNNFSLFFLFFLHSHTFLTVSIIFHSSSKKTLHNKICFQPSPSFLKKLFLPLKNFTASKPRQISATTSWIFEAAFTCLSYPFISFVLSLILLEPFSLIFTSLGWFFGGTTTVNCVCLVQCQLNFFLLSFILFPRSTLVE